MTFELSRFLYLHIFRVKSEQTLQSILLKFDNEVGSRNAELEALQKENFEVEKEHNLWMETVVADQKLL